MTILLEKLDPIHADTMALTNTWFAAIKQKDPAYFSYLRQRGRDDADTRRQEANFMAKTFQHPDHEFNLIQAHEDHVMLGFILWRDAGPNTHISRLCSIERARGVGTRLVGALMSNLGDTSKTPVTLAHENSIDFWVNMGMTKTSAMRHHYGVNVVDMVMAAPAMAHWKKQGTRPPCPVK